MDVLKDYNLILKEIEIKPNEVKKITSVEKSKKKQVI